MPSRNSNPDKYQTGSFRFGENPDDIAERLARTFGYGTAEYMQSLSKHRDGKRKAYYYALDALDENKVVGNAFVSYFKAQKTVTVDGLQAIPSLSMPEQLEVRSAVLGRLLADIATGEYGVPVTTIEGGRDHNNPQPYLDNGFTHRAGTLYTRDF